ncbi:unnamed protein product, partial [marine sediment metagenome]
IAIGQTVDKAMLPKELEYTGWGTLSVDPVTLQTNIDGVFAGGDVVAGPADIIGAIAAGKEAAISIERYLEGADLKEGRPTPVKQVKEVSKEGVEIKTNTPVKNLEAVFNQGYKAIFLGTGAGISQKMGIPGENTKGVIHALDFLRQVNLGVKIELGERVAVIGGGNAAEA